MAVGHYQTNPQTPMGALLRSSLTQLEDGRDDLSQTIDTLIQMKDAGNLTEYAVAQFGFPDVATATAALAELESTRGALDNIAATLNQCFAKFRVG